MCEMVCKTIIYIYKVIEHVQIKLDEKSITRLLPSLYLRNHGNPLG